MTADTLQQRIQDHYEDPYHRGRCEHPTHTAEARNEQCGDVIAIELRVSGEQIEEVWFDGEGCQLSQSTASMLSERLEGKRTQEVADWSLRNALSSLKMDVDSSQIECCKVAFDAVQAALESPYEEDLDGPTFGGPDLGDEC